jgi:Protein of unknown function (DUF4241)
MQLTTHELGQFEVKSGKIIIIDPAYNNEEVGCLPAAKGLWTAQVVKAAISSGWGNDNRCALLFAYLSSAPVEYDDAVWQPLEYGTGVDSGQAGIFDTQHYRDESVVTQPVENPLTGESIWYDLCRAHTLGNMKAGVIPFGVVSSSGWGDGYYPAFGVYQNEELVAVAIHFQVAFTLMPAMSGIEKSLAEIMKQGKPRLLKKIINQALADKNHQTFLADSFIPSIEELQPSYSYFNDLFFIRAAEYTHNEAFLLGLLTQLPNTGVFIDLEYLIDNQQIELFEKIKPFLKTTIDDMGVLNALVYLNNENLALQFSLFLVEIGINASPKTRYDWEEPFVFKLFSNQEFQPLLAEFWLKQGTNPNAIYENKTVWEYTPLTAQQSALIAQFTNIGEAKKVGKPRKTKKEIVEIAENQEVDTENQEVVAESISENFAMSQPEHLEAIEELQAEPQSLAEEAQNLMNEVSQMLADILSKSPKSKIKKDKKAAKDKKAKKDKKAAKDKKDKKSKNLKRFPKSVLLKTGTFKNLIAKVLDSDGKFYLVEIDLFGTAHQKEILIKNTKILKK